jgi:hypothetical protein
LNKYARIALVVALYLLGLTLYSALVRYGADNWSADQEGSFTWLLISLPAIPLLAASAIAAAPLLKKRDAGHVILFGMVVVYATAILGGTVFVLKLLYLNPLVF